MNDGSFWWTGQRRVYSYGLSMITMALSADPGNAEIVFFYFWMITMALYDDPGNAEFIRLN